MSVFFTKDTTLLYHVHSFLTTAEFIYFQRQSHEMTMCHVSGKKEHAQHPSNEKKPEMGYG